MLKNPDYETARSLLLARAVPVGTERLPLSRCGGRVLARPLAAAENIPGFDRSPYDGFAFRAADSAGASKDAPVSLRILEEIPAGAVPTREIVPGTAARLFTGAPIPPGADAVVMFEKTEFTDSHVSLFAPAKPGDNIIRAGDDVKKGVVLAREGDVIDPGLAGTLASQGVAEPIVYKRPRVAVLSTGSELVEAGEEPGAGKIRNSNRHMLEAALSLAGCDTVYLGIAGDSVDDIRAGILRGLAECDAVVTTGGVSVGDYDLTPEAMEAAGAELLFRGVGIKPGMACAYGLLEGKMICALSGNPASALTNFYAVALPAIRKLAGRRDCVPEELSLRLAGDFRKKSPVTRFLRGKLSIAGGSVGLELPGDQGNVVLSSAIGCNVMAIIPAGSGPVPAGTILKGFLI